MKFKFSLKIKKKINIIENILDDLYPNPSNNLYFINEYTLLIAIILTAKSKEQKVNEITKIFFKKFSSPKELIGLSINEIENNIKEIGLYKKKSHYIHKLSNDLIKKYKGVIPKNICLLKKLPGVGQKTASVFLSYMNRNYSVFPIDTHIKRLMKRWKLSHGRSFKQTEKDAKKLFKEKHWKKLHLQLISYGREYSPSRNWNIEKDIIYNKLKKYNLL
ncbi:endonuclease III domain-containing protein [Blattabacterium cuenoti]|uniref:endonuclease III domain-containing protein n=1 Tax=Blattabacterium cuenoti TaxID=1653831 RepID=UPI001CC258B1|nr:endonuclease III [Blattabacterium cuenoti]